MRTKSPRSSAAPSDSPPIIMRALLLSLLLLAVACNSGQEHHDPSGPDPMTLAPPVEASVKPGINERYLDPELSVEWALETFEVESREIYTERHGIVAALGLQAGDRVADVGTGTGLFLPYFAEAVGDRGQVFAVDLAPEFVAHARDRAEELGLAHVTPVLCDERRLRLPEASVDVVFICDTYHHFEYPRTTLASIAKALRPGGRLFVVDFERIPGITREWILGHVRAGKDAFRAEIEAAGFESLGEIEVPGLEENYMLEFRRPE